MSRSEAPTISVVARAPFHVYYEGPATSVTATNKVGVFDVLPGHADFFSMLSPCEVVVEPGNAEAVKFTIRTGILTVRDNEVMLFVNM
jgi:F0F1-type ATP synthase epsilon subunit